MLNFEFFIKKFLKCCLNVIFWKFIILLFGFVDVVLIFDDDDNDVVFFMFLCDGDIFFGDIIGFFDVELYWVVFVILW